MRHEQGGVLGFAQAAVKFAPRRRLNRSTPGIWLATAAISRASQTAPAKTFRLAPSDFAFLWEDCKRCFYLKAHKKLYRPRPPFPSIFGTIDVSMKKHFRGLRTEEILDNVAPGTFLCEEEDAWVECQPITPPGHTSSVYVRGMVDCLIRFDDGTFGIIDFKTSSVSKTSEIYARQLHAYAAAVENPSENSELVQGKVSDMGLVVFTPDQFHTPTDDKGQIRSALTGSLTYQHVPHNEEKFHAFLGEILDVLELPEAPQAPPPKWKKGNSFSSCSYCDFLHRASKTGWIPHAH